MSIDSGYVLIAITIIQAIQIIGRWTGRIDYSESKILEELKKIRETQYKFIQFEQEVAGKIGILENDVMCIKKSCDRRHPE